jgi:methionyl aminopeptidase
MSGIILKTREEIELMRESALIVSKTLGMLASEIKPGVTTLALDTMAFDFIKDQDAEPGFLGLYDFPNTLCMSPNAQVVHGIPTINHWRRGNYFHRLRSIKKRVLWRSCLHFRHRRDRSRNRKTP